MAKEVKEAEKAPPQVKRKPPEGENAGIDPTAASQSQQITDRLNKAKKKAEKKESKDGGQA